MIAADWLLWQFFLRLWCSNIRTESRLAYILEKSVGGINLAVRKWLQRITPSAHEVRNHRQLRIFGSLLNDANLWHLNRRSVSGAVAVGLFVMYLPPLGQMFVAAAVAIFFRVNLPIAVALVWITNPLTMPPMYYFAYRLGAWLLGQPTAPFEMEFWLEWRNWLSILAPLSLGALLCAMISSFLGYFIVQGIWRWRLIKQIQQRKARLRVAGGKVAQLEAEAE